MPADLTFAVVPLVVSSHGRAVTSSLRVAEYFEKEHRNVLRDIRALAEALPPEFSLLNFEQREFIDERGKFQPSYELSKDGFMLLAMGFTGDKALQFKLDYIAAFNRMEAQLTVPREPTALVPILSQVERYRMAALAPETAHALQHVKQQIQSVTAHKKKQPMGIVDCRAILEAVVSDILSWNYACPYAYGFNFLGKAYIAVCSAHIAYHLRNTPHFNEFFERLTWADERRMLIELEYAGLIRKIKSGMVMDGTRLDLLINLPSLQA